MKKLITLILSLIILVSNAFASEFVTHPLVRNAPADVYREPYAEDKFTVTYAPWLKLFNIMREDEAQRAGHGGEACQQVRMLEISPANTDIMYFITDTSGIWKTTNRGEFWYSVSNNIRRGYGKGLICDPKDENIVYCNMRADGVYRSKNGGAIWEMIIEDLDDISGHRSNTLATDAEGNVFIGVAHGLFRLDKETDELVNLFVNDEDTKHITEKLGNKGAYFTDVCVSDDGQIIYATITKRAAAPDVIPGLYVSRDGGKSWELKASDKENLYSPSGVTHHPEDINYLFLGASRTLIKGEEEEKLGFALYVSKDGGDTWEKRYNLIYENKEENVAAHTVNFWKPRFGAKFSDGRYALYIHGQNKTYPFMESYDEGFTFDRVYTPEHRMGEGTFRQSLETVDDWNGKLITGWSNHGYCPDPYIPGRVVFNGAGIHEYTDLDGDADGEIRMISGGFGGLCVEEYLFDSKGRMVMFATDVGNIFQMSEENYSETTYPTFGQSKTVKRLVAGQIDPNDDKHIVAFRGVSNGSDGYHGVHQSFDGGFTWERHEEASFPKDENKKFFETGFPAENNTLFLSYAPENDKKIVNSFYTSYDNGVTWEKNPMFIVAMSHKDSNIMVGSKGTGANCELFLTKDGGKTWEFIVKPGFTRWYDASFDLADDNTLYLMSQKYFAKVNIKEKETEILNSRFNYQYFAFFEQNPKDPSHMLVLTRPKAIPGQAENCILYESRDGGETFYGVPGFWGNQFYEIKFCPTTDSDVFIGSLSGTYIYNYKKYWEYLDSKIYLEIDGAEKTFTQQPQIVNGTAMIPMRELFEHLGAAVSYNADTGAITATRKGKHLTVIPGSTTAVINGEKIELPVAPYINANGKTMLPTGAAWRALDIGVGWSAENRKVCIDTK